MTLRQRFTEGLHAAVFFSLVAVACGLAATAAFLEWFGRTLSEDKRL